MSDRRDQLARKLFKSTIQPTSFLHSFLPSPQDHPSIARLLALSKFPRIPVRTKQYPTYIFYPMPSPTIRLHNRCFIVFIVCVSLRVSVSIYSIVSIYSAYGY